MDGNSSVKMVYYTEFYGTKSCHLLMVDLKCATLGKHLHKTELRKVRAAKNLTHLPDFKENSG